MCTRQSRKVIWGYDQYTVSDDCTCRTLDQWSYLELLVRSALQLEYVWEKKMKKKKQHLRSHGTSNDICCILYGAKPCPEITDSDFRIFDSDWFKLYLAQVLAGTHKGKLRFGIVYLESVGDHPSLNFCDTTVSVKIVGALCCLLALPMLVCKIWWVNCDNQHWEDQETGQK